MEQYVNGYQKEKVLVKVDTHTWIYVDKERQEELVEKWKKKYKECLDSFKINRRDKYNELSDEENG